MLGLTFLREIRVRLSRQSVGVVDAEWGWVLCDYFIIIIIIIIII